MKKFIVAANQPSTPYTPESVDHDEAPQPIKLKTPKVLEPKQTTTSPIQVTSEYEFAAPRANHDYAANHHASVMRWKKGSEKDFHMMLAHHHHSMRPDAKKRGVGEYKLTPEMHKEAAKYHGGQKGFLHGPLVTYHTKKAAMKPKKMGKKETK